MKRNSLRIQRKRLSDQIIDNLISMIASGELKPGDKLPPEPALMEQFGVGRSSIRQAIGALELIGLVTVRPGHGTHVTNSNDKVQAKSIGWSLLTIGHEKIRELVEARVELEQAIVKLAAERATAEEIAEIKAQQKKLKEAKRSGRKLIRADLGFHIALAKASQNSVLLRFLSELRQPMRHWMEQKARYDWGYDQVIEQHEAILSAIEARDSETAQSAMRIHVETAGEKLVSAILETESSKEKK
jgi:GntR family transcriptional repressor for pyruvate dehydrogenase complex